MWQLMKLNSPLGQWANCNTRKFKGNNECLYTLSLNLGIMAAFSEYICGIGKYVMFTMKNYKYILFKMGFYSEEKNQSGSHIISSLILPEKLFFESQKRIPLNLFWLCCLDAFRVENMWPVKSGNNAKLMKFSDLRISFFGLDVLQT